jgi:hypothetical protein
VVRSASIVIFLAVGGVGTAVAGMRSHHHRVALPYKTARYGVEDAKHAFASQGVKLIARSHGSGLTDLTNARDVLEVTVFGYPLVVGRYGFQDLKRGPDCTVEGHLALHWRGNVRAILNCDLVQNDSAWVARIDRALAALR